MGTVYTNESGVRPWESIHPTNNPAFTTTTLIDHDFNSAWESWCDIMDPLSDEWPVKTQWHSAITPDFNSKTEEYLFKKYISKTLSIDDLCKKNHNSNIYSTIKKLPLEPRKIENFAFEGSHDTLLVIQKTEIDIEDFWSRMTIFESQITPEKIGSFLDSQVNTLLCRFYDAETHAAAQFIYKTNHGSGTLLEQIKNRFRKIKIEDVHHYINNTRKP